MEKDHLYQQIAESIRKDILNGKRQPGERLPSVRQLTAQWDCTPGTVQRAYKSLADQGLVISRAGQGTHVTDKPNIQQLSTLRKAALIHKAEAFLLESLSAGYSQAEIEQAIRLALDHWRVIQQEPAMKGEDQIRFAGSNDLAITWIASHFQQILPNYSLNLQFGGSLSGLIALSEKRCELAGCHLWDDEGQDYNTAYVKRILPGKKIGLLTLAERSLGLILPAGNPLGIHGLADLDQADVHFVNRQSGSGTRVWLTARLHEMGLAAEKIKGFNSEKNTHNDLARTIADGEANAGIGLEAAAHIYKLDFIPLTSERFELAFYVESLAGSHFKKLIDWFSSPEAKSAIAALRGYDTAHTGALRWIE